MDAIKQFGKAYFEAVKQILSGTPVEELDDIREQCNKAFTDATGRILKSYSAELIIVGFAADAENRILMGADPIEAYSGFKGLEPEDFRERGRTILENAVQFYL